MQSYTVTFNKHPLKGISIVIKEGVTYLVGKNGAGKSQILEAIKNGNCTIARNESTGHLNRYIAHEWGNKEYNIEVGLQRNYSDLNPHLKELGQPEIQEEETEPKLKKTYNPDRKVTEIFRQSEIIPKRLGSKFDPNYLSTGTKKILERFSWSSLGKAFPENRNYGPSGYRSADSVFLLWDEPEHSIHPSEQKKLPSRFENWIVNNEPRLVGHGNSKRPVFIFVATHSPFILSGIKNEENHNIICLDNCKIVGDSNQKSLSEMRLEANRLLGLGISDVFPGELILAENSINTLIKGLASKFNLEIEKFIITVGGDTKLKSKFETLTEVYNLFSQLGKTWPEKLIFNQINVHLVTDDDGAKEDLKEIKKDNFNISVSALGQEQLEDEYPLKLVNTFLSEKDIIEWVPTDKSFNKFLKENYSPNHTKCGILKSKLAEYIVIQFNDYEQVKKEMPRVFEFFEKWNTQK